MGETTTPTDWSWADLQLFLSVARSGGLSPAARATGRSAATLGRRMQALERGLGRDLFVRHDRGYELTTEAQTLLADLSDIETRLIRVTAPPTGGPRPLIKLSAGTWTTLYLTDFLDEITGTPPDVRLRFVSAEAVLDIPHREITIGFRNRRPEGDNLAGRKMGHVEFAPFATPDAPERWIKVTAQTPSTRWLERKIGSDAAVEVSRPRNALDLALGGHGMALLPTFVGDAQPRLTRRGPTVPELTQDRWIVSHNDDRFLPEVRRVIDRLYTIMSRAPRQSAMDHGRG